MMLVPVSGGRLDVCHHIREGWFFNAGKHVENGFILPYDSNLGKRGLQQVMHLVVRIVLINKLVTDGKTCVQFECGVQLCPMAHGFLVDKSNLNTLLIDNLGYFIQVHSDCNGTKL